MNFVILDQDRQEICLTQNYLTAKNIADLLALDSISGRTYCVFAMTDCGDTNPKAIYSVAKHFTAERINH